MIRSVYPAGVVFWALVFTSYLPAQESAATGPFTFGKFAVPGAVTLSVESINNAGAISGYYMDSRRKLQRICQIASQGSHHAVGSCRQNTPKRTRRLIKSMCKAWLPASFFDSSTATYSGFLYSPLPRFTRPTMCRIDLREP